MSYTFKDKEYTDEEIEAIANEKGYTVGELLAKNSELNKLEVPDLVGKSNSTDQGESVDAAIQPENTPLESEDGDLKPKKSYFNKDGSFNFDGFENKESENLARKSVTPGQTIRSNGFDYKYEVEENKGVYFTKKEGSEKWIQADGDAALAIAGEFAHLDRDRLSNYLGQREEDKKRYQSIIETRKEGEENLTEYPSLTTKGTKEVPYLLFNDKVDNIAAKKDGKLEITDFKDEETYNKALRVLELNKIKKTYYDKGIGKDTPKEVTDEIKQISESVDEGQYNERSAMQFFFQTQDETIDVQNPTREAINLFSKTYFKDYNPELKDPELAKRNVEQAMYLAVTNDPAIQIIKSDIELKSIPLIETKAAELAKKYNTDTVDGNKKYTEELEAYAKTVTDDVLQKNKDYNDRINSIYKVSEAVMQGKDKQAGIKGNAFLSAMQSLRLAPIASSLGLDLIESVGQGFLQIKKGGQASFMAMEENFIQGKKKAIDDIESKLKSGEINEDSMVFVSTGSPFTSGERTAKEALEYYKSESDDWKSNIEKSLENIANSNKELSFYKQANLDDGDISLSDAVLTIGAALPQIGLATAGTLTGVGVLGGLGTATMFTTMFGEGYYDALETGVREDAGAAWGNMSKKQRNALMIDGMESGDYSNKLETAAMTAVMVAAEKFGAKKILSGTQKALGLGSESLGSLYKMQFKQAGKRLLSGMLAKGEATATEFATEYFQEVLGQINKGLVIGGPGGGKKYLDFDSAATAGKSGGIVGFALPFAGTIASQTKVELRNISRDIAINFFPGSGFAQASAIAKESFANIQSDLDKRLKNGFITQKEHQEESIALAGISNAYDSIPVNADKASRETLIDLLVYRNALERTIKKINDPDLSTSEQRQLEITKLQIKGSIARINDTSTVESFAEDLGFTLEKELSIEDLQKIEPSFEGTEYGFIKNNVIYLNDAALKGSIEAKTASHELLHGLLFKAVKDGQMTKESVESWLDDTFDSKTVGALKSMMAQQGYSEEYLTGRPDEYLTQIYEMGLIDKPGMFEKIARFTEQVISKITGGRLNPTFTKKDDLTDFLRDFQKSIKTGKLSQSMKDRAVKESDSTFAASKPKITPKAQEFIELNKEGVITNESLVDIINSPSSTSEDKFGAIEAVVEGNWPVISNAIKFNPTGSIPMDAVKTAVTEQIQGIFPGRNVPLFKGYNPDQGKVNTVIGTFLGPRQAEILERAKKIGGITQEGTSIDSKEAKQTVDTSSEIDLDKKKEKPVKPKESLRKSIPISDAVVQKVRDAVIKTFGTKLGSVENKQDFKEELRKAFRTELKTTIAKEVLGTRDSYETFLRDNFEAIYDAIPQEVINKRFKAFKKPVLKKDGKQLRENTAQGNAVFEKKKISKAEFIKNFLGRDVGASTKGTRKDALAETLAEEFAFDATPETIQTKSVKTKRKFIDEGQSTKKVTEAIGRPIDLAFKKAADQIAQTPEQKPGFSGKTISKNKGKYISKQKGEEKTYSKVDENSDNFKVLTKTLNDFLDKHPEYYPYFRYSTTGTRGTTFENIDKFNEYIDKKETKVKVSRKKYHKNNFLDKGLLNNLLKTLKSDNKAKLNLLQDIFLDIESFLSSKQGKDKAWVFEQVLLDAQKDQNHFLRILVPFGFYPIDFKSGKPLYGFKATEEHADPAVQVGRQLLTAAINGNVIEVMKVVRASSMQGSLLKLDDDSLKPLGLNSDMPKEYFDTVVSLILEGKLDFLPDGFASLIRYTANNNINPFQYQIAGSSQTIGEFFLGKIDTSNMREFMRKSSTTMEISSIANKLITDVITGKIDIKTAKQRFQSNQKIVPLVVKASESNNDKSAFSFSKPPINKVNIDTAARTDKALDNARDLNAPIKKIRVFDFDDTLAQTKSDVLYTMPDGREGKLNAEQFANNGSTLLDEGAVFDFSEFNKVTEGKKGPLFKVAQTIAAKRGTEDVFVLTARAPESQLAIYEFLKSQGLDIPLKNITGLGNSTGDAKARWIVDKAADGYNDFYFADDAPQNVKAVRDALSVIDVKSKTQQAKVAFSKSLDLNKDFNDIIENKTGIGSDKTYSKVKAEVAGASQGKFNFFIPPSAEDFVGLLYSTLGKGDVGDAQMAWYKSHLLNPFARAMENLANDRANMMQDFRGLKKSLGIVPKNLRKKIKDSNFTKEQAVRAYIWDKQGMEIPGISKKDQKDLVDFVNADAELVVFGDQLIEIGKGDAYAAPDAGWVAGTIDTDFIKALNTTKRSKYLETWQQNVDQIFSEANLNKLEAAYGANYREAMVDMLKRMRTGRNTSSGSDRLAARFTDWLTNSVGAIMFFNTRSAVLQTISAVNFINFSDNNVLKAGQAFANQPQYWSDFKKLFNSPFLLDRRSGLKLNVNEADIATMAKGPGNSARNVIAGILKAGFLPTQLADSFAIASGGASFYRNRIKALQKEGLTEAEAEEQAFRDFREIAEESQQSSRPDKISQQQAGPLGRVVLAFANTPAQYARLIKKAASDLKNGRGDAKTNISKIIYYGVAQNLLFSALQQALFAIAFDDEEEEEKKNEKYFNIVNGMSDSILRGIGIGGAIVSVVKNTALRLAKEADKKSPKYQDAVVKGVLQISPPVSSKVGKLQSAGRSFSWNQEEMRTRGFSIDNPAYLAIANVISAATNVPLDRAIKKITNIVDAGNEDIEYYKRVALALGWSAWELGIDKKGGKVTPPKTDMDKLYDLTKKQQIDSLTNLGISKKQIKLLKLEEDRVKAILDPKSIKKIKVSKRDSLFGLNKKDQIQALEKLGLTKKEIRALRLESDRVEAIINKQKQEN